MAGFRAGALLEILGLVRLYLTERRGPAGSSPGSQVASSRRASSQRSLLIYDGRPPILVAAALGHGDTQTLWRHYAGVFAEAEVAARIPVEEAIAVPREAVRTERNVPTSFPRRPRDDSPEVSAEVEKSSSAGRTKVRAAGFEPATSGSGGQRSIH
jgi:hypothetical protein